MPKPRRRWQLAQLGELWQHDSSIHQWWPGADPDEEAGVPARAIGPSRTAMGGAGAGAGAVAGVVATLGTTGMAPRPARAART